MDLMTLMLRLANWSKCVLIVGVAACANVSFAQQLEVPRRHDRPPGPPLSAEDAVQRMTAPQGFTVELVACEPDVINPVGMFIDEKGRFWITESVEYPRREPGPGRDRVKVLEDTDGDGRVDRTTVFAEGLNIPSGIAVGYGGVWVMNAPDLLFMQDTDGDLKADNIDVVLTGFGRTDTHELPNSLTWGPDGWLYGNNGIFNACKVTYPESNPNYKPGHPGWGFGDAIWRVHPRTREFQLFATGISNHWGIAFDAEGELFVSACVIDHLWHVVQGGQYVRQATSYPAHAWPIPSIVKHKHQKAAYCGITWFDSDAYPAEYREVLYMGNIHGGCINADVVTRNGSTFAGFPHPGFTPQPGAWDKDEYGSIAKTGEASNPLLADLLTANDPWFMPVAQKTGPDGCLYVLDWYDQYHCYQDANADPEGVERGKGRLYRLRYEGVPHAQPFDLAQKSEAELIELLGDPNVYLRDAAQRLLTERDTPGLSGRLLNLIVQEPAAPLKQRRYALFALMGLSFADSDDWKAVARTLWDSGDAVNQAWAIRLLTNQGTSHPNEEGSDAELARMVLTALEEPGTPPPVRLQAVIYVGQTSRRTALGAEYAKALGEAISHAGDDQALVQMIWSSLRVFLDHQPQHLANAVEVVGVPGVVAHAPGQELVLRLLNWIVGHARATDGELESFAGTVRGLASGNQAFAAVLLRALTDSVRQGQFSPDRQEALITAFLPLLKEIRNGSTGIAQVNAASLQAVGGEDSAREFLRTKVRSASDPEEVRVGAVRALAGLRDPELVGLAALLLRDAAVPQSVRTVAIENLASVNDPEVAKVLLDAFPTLVGEMQPKAIEVLTQRPRWSLAMLRAIDAGALEKSLLNFNQLQRVATFENKQVQELLAKHYGQVRGSSRADRQRVIFIRNDMLHGSPGDPFKGQEIFKKTCAVCHKIYGEGADVGPDITRNGRNNWDQLLQNVFDPNAVIGADYQARILATADGRVLTGLLVEETDERVVIKMQGGKVEAIARDDIEQYKVSELSMMPEEIEKLVTPQELADLFAFLALDKPPSDSTAKILPGAPAQQRR